MLVGMTSLLNPLFKAGQLALVVDSATFIVSAALLVALLVAYAAQQPIALVQLLGVHGRS